MAQASEKMPSLTELHMSREEEGGWTFTFLVKEQIREGGTPPRRGVGEEDTLT